MRECRCIRVAVIVILILGGSAGSALSGRTDFRGTYWGMSRLEVMASEETGPSSFREPYLYYRPEILGRTYHLIYEFIENRLIEAVYIVVTRDKTDYRRLRKHLEITHGKPAEAVDEGDRNFRFVWATPTTDIIMQPGKLRECRIEYYSKRYRYLKSGQIKQASDDLLKEIRRSF